MRISDWSSDVCSSDLLGNQAVEVEAVVCIAELRPPFAAGQRQREIAPQPIARERQLRGIAPDEIGDAAQRDMRSEEHTSALQSLMRTSYAVFCLKKKNTSKEPTDAVRSTSDVALTLLNATDTI